MKVHDLRRALLKCDQNAECYGFDPSSQTMYLIQGGHQIAEGLLSAESKYPDKWIVMLLPNSASELNGGF